MYRFHCIGMEVDNQYRLQRSGLTTLCNSIEWAVVVRQLICTGFMQFLLFPPSQNPVNNSLLLALCSVFKANCTPQC